MDGVWVKKGREKPLKNRHPWVFSGAVLKGPQKRSPGDLVDVFSQEGERLGQGFWNPKSQICVRMVTFAHGNKGQSHKSQSHKGEKGLPGPSLSEVDAPELTAGLDLEGEKPFWRHAIERALRKREAMKVADTDAYRLVMSDQDGVPGLIVDQYGSLLVMQALTLGVEKRLDLFVDLLKEKTASEVLYESSDESSRTLEGLSPRSRVVYGTPKEGGHWFLENGVHFSVDPLGGHKTGFYLDQRINHRSLMRYVEGKRVLDLFSYTGGFGVTLARSAAHVTSVDQSKSALERLHQHAVKNGVEKKITTVHQDAFTFLRDEVKENQQYDVVILDPPKFASTSHHVPKAARGYKDINRLGLMLLREGGVLATYSCSGHVEQDLFQKIVFGAAVDAGRDAHILEYQTQAPDHVMHLNIPESLYLKGLVLGVEHVFNPR